MAQTIVTDPPIPRRRPWHPLKEEIPRWFLSTGPVEEPTPVPSDDRFTVGSRRDDGASRSGTVSSIAHNHATLSSSSHR